MAAAARREAGLSLSISSGFRSDATRRFCGTQSPPPFIFRVVTLARLLALVAVVFYVLGRRSA
jgi:hypothetical protein